MNDEIETFKKFKNDLNFFARNCLYIKTKNSKIEPFVLNNTQLKVHNFINNWKQNKKYKFVVLKARQFGISTYTEARLFWKTMFNEATNSFIMADSTSSANNIFEMTKRFYDLLPDGMIKPDLKKSNEKAIVFDDIDSSFRIGTAGNKQIGRSMTINYLHCSEVGFWDNANEIIAGLFQTVPTNGESEIILESTANGVGNYFHDMCLEGIENNSDFKTLFLPWFENPEYSLEIEDVNEFKLTDEEKELKTIYKLSDKQINWRRNKIFGDFKGREFLFRQEYPANFNEAFITNNNALLKTEILEQARRNNFLIPDCFPLIMGVDPARNGDRTVIVFRKGRKVYKPIIFEDMTETQLAGEVIYLLNKYNVKKCFIDVGYGYGTLDILREKGLGEIVNGIPFNSRPNKREIYSNKRTEIYGELRDWTLQDGGVIIPDDQVLINELLSIPEFNINSNGQYVMKSKDEIKKILNGKSPDIADAIALTFADNVPILNQNSTENAIKIINNIRKRQ